MNEHTAGKWVCVSGMVETSGGIPIAYMDRVPGNGTMPCERDANARLIALVPDMLDVCEMVLEADKIDGPDRHLAFNAAVILAEHVKRKLT